MKLYVSFNISAIFFQIFGVVVIVTLLKEQAPQGLNRQNADFFVENADFFEKMQIFFEKMQIFLLNISVVNSVKPYVHQHFLQLSNLQM